MQLWEDAEQLAQQRHGVKEFGPSAARWAALWRSRCDNMFLSRNGCKATLQVTELGATYNEARS